jgi:phosphoglycolate phosphatase-like HAD superfamily hydrolase
VSNLASFKASKKLISDGPNLFYVFPDKLTEGLPTTLEDAFNQGFLVIVCTNKPGQYSLNIANENYTGDFNGLALILFDWASSEGYQWAPLRRVSLPGEPHPIRYRRTASGYRVAWDEPGENF